MRAFAARFAGRCGICEEDFDEGDRIVYVDDETCHAQCARDEGEEVDGDV